jgi:hypothetical protein
MMELLHIYERKATSLVPLIRALDRNGQDHLVILLSVPSTDVGTSTDVENGACRLLLLLFENTLAQKPA